MPYRDDELIRQIGAQLQAARKRAGLTQEQLAEDLGVEVSTLSRYETGDRPISISLLAKAADRLGVELIAFLPRDIEADSEQALLASWRALDAERRGVVQELLRLLTPTL